MLFAAWSEPSAHAAARRVFGDGLASAPVRGIVAAEAPSTPSDVAAIQPASRSVRAPASGAIPRTDFTRPSTHAASSRPAERGLASTPAAPSTTASTFAPMPTRASPTPDSTRTTGSGSSSARTSGTTTRESWMCPRTQAACHRMSEAGASSAPVASLMAMSPRLIRASRADRRTMPLSSANAATSIRTLAVERTVPSV